MEFEAIGETLMAKKETKKPAKPLALGKTPKPAKVISKAGIHLKFSDPL
jgi:hypothetical protein